MSFDALKAQQSVAWGSAPWEPMAARLAAVHDHGFDRSPVMVDTNSSGQSSSSSSRRASFG